MFGWFKRYISGVYIDFFYNRLKLACDKMEYQLKLAKDQDVLLNERLNGILPTEHRVTLTNLQCTNKAVMFRLCEEIAKAEMFMEKMKQNCNN